MVYRIRWTPEQRSRFVARWLKFRADFGLTQKQLAEAMGIHVATVNRVERGKYVPNDETVNKFAEVEQRYKIGAEAERDLAWVPNDTDL